ncbi:OmpA family protein [Nocardia puris]|uniref:OmpA family protein n=1 Tax=Nocardia puris TaxID=208602 RepID=UPI002E1F3D89
MPVKKFASTLLATALTTLVLTACGSSPTQPPGAALSCDAGRGALVIAASGRHHSARARVDGELRAIIERAVRAEAPVYIVGVDGEPAQTWKRPAGEPPANGPALQDYVDSGVAAVAAALSRVRADDPQVDVLASLSTAARVARGAGTDVATVVLLDSGLQTMGALDFRVPGVLAADPTEVVEHLRRVGALPDLDGVNVLLGGLGATTGAQPRLSDAQITNLVAIHTATATAAGARCVAVLDTVADPLPVESPHPVDLVPVPAAPTFISSLRPTVFHSDTIGFHPDSEDFLDAARAGQALTPIVRALRADHSLRVTVTGTCASGTGHGRDPFELSTARANAVRALLIRDGIPGDRVLAVGVGTNFPEFVPDLSAAGELLPGPAALNRSVRLLIHP